MHLVSRGTAKQKILQSALQLFHRQGVKGTSIDEILSSAHAGKGQFAHYFKNKDGLVLATIDYLQEIVRSGAVESNYALSSWDDFDQWFNRYIGFQKSVDCAVSCPLGTIGNDLTESQELLRRNVKSFFDWARAQLTRFFAERRAIGELPHETDPEGLADLCLVVMEGGMLLSKIDRGTKSFERAAKQVLEYVRNLRDRAELSAD